MNGLLANRTLSGFPLSISTGLAFESIFNARIAPYDPDRQIPNKVDISEYKYFYINVSTLIRNMTNSIDSKLIATVKPSEYASYIKEEIEVVKSILLNEGRGIAKPIFYYCTYHRLLSKSTNKAIMLRVDTTEKQKIYTGILTSTLQLISKNSPDILGYDSELETYETGLYNSLILTHVAIDLLSYKRFNKLDLIESNTGVLKTRYQYSTKYYDGSNLPPLPFNKRLLLVFGDNEIFKPNLRNLKQTILEIANKCKWTPFTTDDKILLDLDINLKERFVYEVIKNF